MDKPESMCPLSSFGMWVSQQSQKLCNPWIAWLQHCPSPACREEALCACAMGGSVHSESNLKTLSQHSWDTHGDDCA